ncbi:MAG: hypothetical protein R6X02_29885 [Enhygromyxa sp.]
MLTTALLTLALFSPSETAPGVDDVDAALCLPIPAKPVVKEVEPFSEVRADGSRSLGAIATYSLSSGDTGEAFLVIDSTGIGEAQIMINGTIVAQASIADDPAMGRAVVTTWYPADVNFPPEVIAEMIRVDLPAILAEQIPQEFKCSGWGQKVTKAASVLFRATAYAAGGACCAATGASIVGCAICAAGSGVVADEVGKVIDNHCD